MIEYLTINYGLNNTYNLNQKVFKTIVYRAAEKINSKIEIEDVEVEITHNCTNVSIDFSFKIPKEMNLEKNMLFLRAKIVDYVINLIDISPSNIKMIYKGRI